MRKPELILIGAGGHAKACIDVVELEGKYKIVGLIGNDTELDNKVLGYPVIGTDKDLPKISKEFQYALIAIGQIKTLRLLDDVG